MELTRRFSPALPVLDAICKDVDRSFMHLYHGTNHTAPNAHRDIARMLARFHDADIHVFTPGRTYESSSDRPVDFFLKGVKDLESGAFFNECWEIREVFMRYASTAQEFDLPPSTPVASGSSIPPDVAATSGQSSSSMQNAPTSAVISATSPFNVPMDIDM